MYDEINDYEDAWEEYQGSEADEIDKVGDNIRMRYEQS